MTTFSSKLFRSILLAVVAASAAVGQAGVVVLEGPYAGMADSPFRGFGERLIVEDFEDGVFDLPGVRLSERAAFLVPRVVSPAEGAVSIDPDGHSLSPYYEIATPTIPRYYQSHIRFAFDALPEGMLHFGFVVTAVPDNTRLSLRAFGLDGEAILQSDRFIEAWSNPLFLGVASDVPLSRVEISGHARGHETYFQIDHVQMVVPEPAAGLLLALGAAYVVLDRLVPRARGGRDG